MDTTTASTHLNGRGRSGQYVRFALATSVGAASVAALTYGGYELHVNLLTSGLLYLLLVVVVSMIAGFWEATIISLLAVTCLNYFFFTPVLTFFVSDPQNWVALSTFEVSALIVSKLSTRVKSQAKAEAQHRLLVQKLYELSRRILLLDRRQTPGPQIVFLIRQIFHVEASLFDAVAARSDATESCSKDVEELARSTYFTDGIHLTDGIPHELEGRTWQRVQRLGSKSIGAIVLRGGGLNPTTTDAIASLSAIALERARSFETESRSEAARHSEQLRAAVLDALGHAFKTPLTVIRTASSGLLETGHLTTNDAKLVALIDKETEQLNQLASRLLQTARIDDARLRPCPERISIATLIEKVLAEHRKQLCEHTLHLSVNPSDLFAYGDPEMLATGIGHLIDNAAKYSTTGSPVIVSAEETMGEVVIAVHNEGSTIRWGDRERIFERFYRTEESKHRAPGTGLGLSIAKRTAEAHRGRVWVVSEQNKGTTFFFAIPQHTRTTHELVAR
jgi:two-component system sensor histidine kinase KdpD